MKSISVGITPEIFLREYVEALSIGRAAVFVGAGLSRASGLLDWKELLKDFAREIGLDLEIEADLTLVAQYHLNHEQQNRNRLHQKLVDTLGSDAMPSASHEILARLPIRIYWTSNYDDLIERALRGQKRKPDVKRSSSELVAPPQNRDATVYKMHGDLSDPGTIMITHDDYAKYTRLYPLFRDRLRADLAEQTFLFLGFSFSDPHLDFILNEIKAQLGDKMQTHYVVLRRESKVGRTKRHFEYATNRQRLKIIDLERFGIKTLLIDSFGDLPILLQTVEERYYRRQVFISGAVDDYSPLGKPWIEEFTRRLGSKLILEDFNIVNGFGFGIGSPLIFGALEEIYKSDTSHIDRRLKLRPFPYTNRRKDLYTRYRKEMIEGAGFAIFIAGNRRASNGKDIELSAGMREEYELAIENGLYPIAVGASGWLAAELSQEILSNFAQLFPKGTRKRSFITLNKSTLTVDEALASVMSILIDLRNI